MAKIKLLSVTTCKSPELDIEKYVNKPNLYSTLKQKLLSSHVDPYNIHNTVLQYELEILGDINIIEIKNEWCEYYRIICTQIFYTKKDDTDS